MTQDNEKRLFVADTPIEQLEEDQLNRAGFARGVCQSIQALPAGSSMTIGIHGPWGDGKTSVLNLVAKLMEADEGISIAHYNPWRFADEDAMLDGFFRALGKCLESRRPLEPTIWWKPTTWPVFRNRRKALEGTWESTCRQLHRVVRVAEPIHKSAQSAGGLLSRWASPGVEELRRRLHDLLLKEALRIVVLIDDIDRLDKHEIYTLFRLVKSCADLPNVTYVLAFDEAIVADSLAGQYGSGGPEAGRAFLEKVIQVPLQLPPARVQELRSLCFQQVDQALSASGYELTSKQAGDFAFAFQNGVDVRLATPRLAKKYGNAVTFALPLLRGEVNPVDVLLVQALRVFYPQIFEVVRGQLGAFSGVEERTFGSSRKEPVAKTLLDPVLAGLSADVRRSIESLLTNLFPRMSGVFGSSFYGSDWLGRWDEGKRVCSPTYCSRYFTYAIAADYVPDAVVEELIAGDAPGAIESTEAILSRYLQHPTAGNFIARLRAATESIDPDRCEKLALAVASRGSLIPNRRSLFSFMEPAGQGAMLIAGLIGRLPQSRRSAVAKEIVRLADPLWFACECLRWLYVTDDEQKQDSNAVTKDELEEIRDVLADRIADEFANGYDWWTDESGQRLRAVYDWRRSRGRQPVQEYLLGVMTAEPRRIVQFLRAIAPDAWPAGSATPVPGDIDGNVLENIEFIMGLDELAALVLENCEGEFDDPKWFPDSDRSTARQHAEQFVYCWRQRQNKSEVDAEPNPDAESASKDSPPDGLTKSAGGAAE